MAGAPAGAGLGGARRGSAPRPTPAPTPRARPGRHGHPCPGRLARPVRPARPAAARRPGSPCWFAGPAVVDAVAGAAAGGRDHDDDGEARRRPQHRRGASTRVSGLPAARRRPSGRVQRQLPHGLGATVLCQRAGPSVQLPQPVRHAGAELRQWIGLPPPVRRDLQSEALTGPRLSRPH